MKRFTKQFVIIIFLAALTVSFSGCNEIEVNEKEMQDVQMRFEQFIRDNGEEIVLEKIDTTDWQVYTDEERKFSFKYPNDWTLKEMPYKKHGMYKDCYKMPGMERGGCGDEFAHYDIKTTLHPTAFLCLIPNNENIEGDCFVWFSQIDPTLKNVGTAVNVYEKNYGKKTFTKPFEYFFTNGNVFIFNRVNFVLDSEIFSVRAYDWGKKEVILLNNKIVNSDIKKYSDDFSGIIQSINKIQK